MHIISLNFHSVAVDGSFHCDFIAEETEPRLDLSTDGFLVLTHPFCSRWQHFSFLSLSFPFLSSPLLFSPLLSFLPSWQKLYEVNPEQ